MRPLASDVAVVGGGLSGLAVAEALARAGQDVRVLEARDRVGGRILSPKAAGGRFDLGPAWIWPHNARMLRLADRLGLSVHRQHSDGTLVYEDGAGRIQRDLTLSTMGDALRVEGGTARLAEGLAAQIPASRLHLMHGVHTVKIAEDAVTLGGMSAEGPFRLRAGKVVLALPLRLVASLALGPAPEAAVLRALRSTPTWMAGHAKVVAVYREAFWRKAGLSGDAISHRGPMMEIHDATDEAAGLPALFGFAAPSREARDEDVLAEAAVAHLGRLFGPEAASPREVLVKDWLGDPNTATAEDADLPTHHPSYGLPPVVAEWAGRRIHVAGTEAARREGGFLEGALEAADAVVARLSVPV